MVLLFPSLWSLIKSFLSAPISATISSISITSWSALTMVGVAGSPSLPNPRPRWVLWPSPCPGWVCSRRICVKPVSRAILSPLPLAEVALMSPSCASVSPHCTHHENGRLRRSKNHKTQVRVLLPLTQNSPHNLSFWPQARDVKT